MRPPSPPPQSLVKPSTSYSPPLERMVETLAAASPGQGLVMLAGATGSGKTSVIAGMVRQLVQSNAATRRERIQTRWDARRSARALQRALVAPPAVLTSQRPRL